MKVEGVKAGLENWLQYHPKTVGAITILLTLLGLGWIIGPLLWAPNSHMYTFGGDGLVLYYDAAYHIMHGKPGVMLDAMLYPKEELIFMTDAQGAWLIIWQWISRNIVDLSAYVSGLIHTTNNIGVLLAAPFVYSILTKLSANRLVGLLFTPLVVLLSPQILRIGGHFGLAYPFIIPMTIWWLLRARRRLDLKDILVIGTLTFFTFNNPYVGFSAGLTLFAYAGLFALLNLKTIFKSSHVLIPALGMAFALAVPYLTFKVLDPFTSRVDLQWGAFYYKTSFAGTFFPKPSLVAQWFSQSPNLTFAGKQYVGATAILLVFGGLAYYGIQWLNKNRTWQSSISAPKRTWLLYVLSATVVYFLVYDWGFPMRAQMFLEESAGFLLLFKSASRLAWPFYFAFTISGVLFLSTFIDWLKSKNVAIGYACLAIVFIFNCIDVGDYHKKRFKRDYDNFYELSRFEVLKSKVNKAGVYANDYQAILSVPRQLAWNGNVFVDWKWGTHFGSTNASVALGLPLINATLGRSPVRPLMDVTQLMSRPEIDRSDFLDLLPNQKPILLVQGKKDTVLSEGEEFLISLADTVYSDKRIRMFKLEVEDLRRASGSLSATKINALASTPTQPMQLLSEQLQVGEYKTIMSSSRIGKDTTHAQLTGWIKASSARHGQGFLFINIFDDSDKKQKSERVEVRRIQDASNGWYYLVKDYEVQRGDSLVVTFIAPQKIKLEGFSLSF